MFRLHTEDGDAHDFTDALEMFEFVSERIDNELTPRGVSRPYGARSGTGGDE